MTLVVFHAVPGTRGAESLALLGSLVASNDETAERPGQAAKPSD